MSADRTREPGWYPDPWGTAEERYFDGTAWARGTRPVGGPDAPLTATADPAVADAPGPGTDAPAPSAVPSVPPPPPTAPPVVPAGWYPDPGGTGGLRWWDGTVWTAHVAPPAVPGAPAARTASPTDPVELERRLARMHAAGRAARVLLLGAGLAQALNLVAFAFQARWVATNWDSISAGGSVNPPINEVGGSALVNFGTLAQLLVITTGVVWLIWFARAAALSRDLGHAPRRPVGLGVASYFLPIVSLWWPYRAMVDVLPAEHPARQVVRRWWVQFVLAYYVATFAAFCTAFIGDAALVAVTAAGAVLSVTAAASARVVVAHVVDVQDEAAQHLAAAGA